MNFKCVTLVLLLLVSVNSFSQKQQKILFKIANEPVTTNEFINVYKKNLNLIKDEENGIENYLELFINYKLKVKEAKDLKLDTASSYKKELNKYKETLTIPYLKDDAVTNKLVKEAFNRLKKEINASHILIFSNKGDSPEDTLKAYNKIVEARKRIVEGGEDFVKIAKEYSQDQSVKQNGGNIGFFTALQMVYPFESAAYNTEVGKVSTPIKTKFGYHILKVNDIRESKGEIEVAHIMLKNPTEINKRKIDSIYTLLTVNNHNFGALAKKVSQDQSSAVKGGKMTKFSYGKMLEPFAKQAFAIENEGEIAKPFKTKYGWHILKLLKKHPIDNFEDIKVDLKKRIEKDSRSHLIGKSIVDSLYNIYSITINQKALKQFNINQWRDTPEKFTSELMTIEDKKIDQQQFISYLKKYRRQKIEEAFKNFKEIEVLTYFKENLQFTNHTFAATLKEFSEGLMLFDLLEQKVWDKSKDSIGLNNYYNKFKVDKYKNKELKEIKGIVTSDYQEELENNWIKELRETYKVEVNKKEKKKVLKYNFNNN